MSTGQYYNNDNQKYIINVNFRTGSIIHLNSQKHKVDQRCVRRESKRFRYWVLTFEDEVKSYLKKIKPLFFEEKEVTNLRKCKLCSQIKEYGLDEFPDTESDKPSIEYNKIEQFLDDIKIDISKIVDYLIVMQPLKEKKWALLLKDNIGFFNNSIDRGKKILRQRKFQTGLIDHAFYGKEFERKLMLFYDSRNYSISKQELEFEKVEEMKDDSRTIPQYRRIISRVLSPLKRHLGAINVILGSLANVISVLGMAEEFKQTAEQAVELAKDYVIETSTFSS